MQHCLESSGLKDAAVDSSAKNAISSRPEETQESHIVSAPLDDVGTHTFGVKLLGGVQV